MLDPDTHEPCARIPLQVAPASVAVDKEEKMKKKTTLGLWMVLASLGAASCGSAEPQDPSGNTKGSVGSPGSGSDGSGDNGNSENNGNNGTEGGKHLTSAGKGTLSLKVKQVK